MLPSTFLSLPINEQAFIYAAIDIKNKHDEEEAKKMKSKSPRKGRRR